MTMKGGNARQACDNFWAEKLAESGGAREMLGTLTGGAIHSFHYLCETWGETVTCHQKNMASDRE